MTFAVIALSVAVLVLSIIDTIIGARNVDLVQKYLDAENEKRRAQVEAEGLRSELSLAHDENARHDSALRETINQAKAAQMGAIRSADAAGVRDILNSVLADENSDGRVASSSTAADTMPHRTAPAVGPERPGRGVPR